MSTVLKRTLAGIHIMQYLVQTNSTILQYLVAISGNRFSSCIAKNSWRSYELKTWVWYLNIIYHWNEVISIVKQLIWSWVLQGRRSPGWNTAFFSFKIRFLIMWMCISMCLSTLLNTCSNNSERGTRNMYPHDWDSVTYVLVEYTSIVVCRVY